jgi:CRP/FNR family cyclic AMP-dependent transcriptional regulator
MFFHKTRQLLGTTYAPGEIIFRQGDPPGSLYVILEGKVEISMDPEPGDESGQPVRIGVLETDSVFGEMSLFHQKPRVATACAKTRVRLLTLDHKGFMQRLQDDPVLSLRILMRLSERIHAMLGELIRLHREQGTMTPGRSLLPAGAVMTGSFWEIARRLVVDLLVHPTQTWDWVRGRSLLTWAIALQCFRWWITSVTTMVHLYVSDMPVFLPVPWDIPLPTYRYFEIFAYGPYGMFIVTMMAWYLWRQGQHHASVQSMHFAKSWELVGLSFFAPWLPSLIIDNILIHFGLGTPEVIVPWHIAIVILEAGLLYLGLRSVFGMARKTSFRLAAGAMMIFLVLAGILIR